MLFISWMSFKYSFQDFQSYLPISQDEYFQLVDWTGRTLRDDKRGAIPAHLAPILQRLKINENNWIEGIQHYGQLFLSCGGGIASLEGGMYKARTALVKRTACS